MDSYNNNTSDTKTGVEPRERKQNYMRQYEREIEPCTKLSEKVMIPIKKYPKVLLSLIVEISLLANKIIWCRKLIWQHCFTYATL